jgi:hypothetical protein
VSNKNDIFDDLIKSQLEGFDANVSMADWDAIASKLPVAERKKVAAYWWVTGLAILVVGILTTAIWHNFNNASNDASEVVILDENQTLQKESVVKNNNIPTPNEAPTEKTVNEPNLPENLNTEIKTTSTEVDSKTSVQSTTEPDNLPTNIVDIKADEDHIKGVDDSAFSTDLSDNSSNDDVDPATSKEPVILAVTDSSQTGNKNEPILIKSNPKWELGVSFSPNWAKKIISANGDNAWRINKRYNHIANTMESGSISYQLEAHVNRYLNDNVYVNAGINYNQITEKVNYNYEVTEFATERVGFNELLYTPIDPRIGAVEINYSGTNTYHYIESPIRIGYLKTIPNAKMNFRVETGLRYMVLADMSGKRTDVTQIESLVDLKSAFTEYSRHNLGATANAGVYWQIMKGKGDFGLTTYYNYALTSIRKRDEGITEKPYNFGVNFSLQRKIWIK